MRTALIYVRIIVAVSMTSFGVFLGQAAEGFQKYRSGLEMTLVRVVESVDSDPSPANRERLGTARAFKDLGEEAIREAEVTNLVVSGVFAVVSLFAVLAGNRLKAELRRPR